jgi:hypothetical protein
MEECIRAVLGRALGWFFMILATTFLIPEEDNP